MRKRKGNNKLVDKPQDTMGIEAKDVFGDSAAGGLADRAAGDAFNSMSTNELLNINDRLGDLYGQRSPDSQETALTKWLDDVRDAMTASLASYLPVPFTLRYTAQARVQSEPLILPADDITVHLHIESAASNVFVTAPPPFIRFMINACYGGADCDPKLNRGANFTQFEHSFVGDLSRALIKSALRTTSNEHALSTDLKATLIAIDQEKIRLETPDGLNITWEVEIGDQRQSFFTALPASCIEALNAAPATSPQGPSAEADSEWSNRIRDKLNNTISRLQAIIRLGEISLGDVAALQPGSTIEIGKAGTIELTIESEQKSIFSGKMGQKNGHYAVNIEKSLEK